MSTYCTAKLPSPPEAPHTRTESPWVTGAPLCETSIRYAVELHRALTAASSQLRCAGLGISWFAFTTAISASPPKFVSKPQIRWFTASMESSWALGSWSSTWLQCTVTLSPGRHDRTAEPTFSTTPAASEPITWWSRACRAPQADSRPRRSRKPNVDIGSKIEVHTVLKLIDEAMTAT